MNTIEPALQALFHAIAQAQDEQELQQPIMAQIGQYFVATRWKLTFLAQLPVVNARTPSMMKLALSLDYNPVLRYLVERHAPVHEEMILPPNVWQTLCPRADHGHVMIGPIINNGELVGGIAVTRHRDHPAFNTNDLANLSALCIHVSTRLAVIRQQVVLTLNCDRLTPREIQIAKLVAQGLTSAEIGGTIWITENSVKKALKRMFRKLEVSSRAEMIAKLALNGSAFLEENESISVTAKN